MIHRLRDLFDALRQVLRCWLAGDYPKVIREGPRASP